MLSLGANMTGICHRFAVITQNKLFSCSNIGVVQLLYEADAHTLNSPLAGSRDTSRRRSGKAVWGGWPLCPCCLWSSCRSCAESRSSSSCSSRSSLSPCRSSGPGCSLYHTHYWSQIRLLLGSVGRRGESVIISTEKYSTLTTDTVLSLCHLYWKL